MKQLTGLSREQLGAEHLKTFYLHEKAELTAR